MNKSVCIVTSAHLSYNPRALKEADALSEAGFDVRVVGVTHDDQRKFLDEELVKTRAWRFESLDVRKSGSSYSIWCYYTLRQRFFAAVFKITFGRFGLESSYSRYWTGLARLASNEKADLYIAHNLPALPAAAKAARRHGAKLGFDAEDFHRGEFLETVENSSIIALTTAVEEIYIPQCEHLTAASDGIGDIYTQLFGITRPLTILNVFPLSLRSGIVPKAELAKERRGEGLSLYWYSQVIGPDRGLEDVLDAMALVGPGVYFHIRGAWAAGYDQVFMAKARELGIADQVHYLSPVPPDELIERAAMHDVGLALEPGDRRNNDIAVSNKLLAYLLSGLVVIASDTQGQRAIMSGVSGVGYLIGSDKVIEISNYVSELIADKAKLVHTKNKSLYYSNEIYCWDKECLKLVKSINNLIPGSGNAKYYSE